MKWLSLAAAVAASALLAGCAVGPKYQRPQIQAPTAYKTEGPWRVAAPKDSLPKGAWWEIFNDAELNNYEQQLLKANQSLAAAQDRLNQARALAEWLQLDSSRKPVRIRMPRATATLVTDRKLSPLDGRSPRAPTRSLFCSVTSPISLENTGGPWKPRTRLCKPRQRTCTTSIWC